MSSKANIDLGLELKYVQLDDCRLAYFERGQASATLPTLFFVHATGFHGRIWDYHIEALPDFHCISLEQRGHGRSDKLAVDHWRTFGEDLAQVVKILGLDRVIGIGHSMGAHALVEGAHQSGAFSRLLLLDPVISAPENYQPAVAPETSGDLHPAAKRRNKFASVDDMRDQLRSKSAFPLFNERIFDDYCTYALEPDGEGVRLCCEPEVEAHVYMGARSNIEVFDAIRQLDIPVTIVRAQLPDPDKAMDWSGSPTWPNLWREFPQGTEHHWDTCTHFIPMQRPDEVIEVIRVEIDQWR
ncbi:MAG: lipase [Limisphaerales bacterium]